MHRFNPTVRSWALAAIMVFVAAGCNDGQLVDAGGEHGQGGLAFVLLAFFFLIFIAALFYMDRVRQRRSGDDTDANS